MYNSYFIEENLPQPLTNEEIIELLHEYKKRNTNVKNKIIHHNIRLVIKEVLKNFNNTMFDEKDLISIGIIGLIKSVDGFKVEKHFKFSNYARKCIDNEILMFLRNIKKLNNNVSINEILYTSNDGDQITIEDNLEDNSFNMILDYEQKELKKLLFKIVNQLPDLYKKMIIMYFGFGNRIYTQEDIAKKFGFTQSYVSRLIKNGIKEIKRKLINLDYIEINNKKEITKIKK